MVELTIPSHDFKQQLNGQPFCFLFTQDSQSWTVSLFCLAAASASRSFFTLSTAFRAALPPGLASNLA